MILFIEINLYFYSVRIFFICLFIKESWKNVDSTKILSITTVFNIDHTKCFQINLMMISEHLTLKTWMAAKILLYHHRNKWHVSINYYRKQSIKMVLIFYNLLYFDQINAALVSPHEFFEWQIILNCRFLLLNSHVDTYFLYKKTLQSQYFKIYLK